MEKSSLLLYSCKPRLSTTAAPTVRLRISWISESSGSAVRVSPFASSSSPVSVWRSPAIRSMAEAVYIAGVSQARNSPIPAPIAVMKRMSSARRRTTVSAWRNDIVSPPSE